MCLVNVSKYKRLLLPLILTFFLGTLCHAQISDKQFLMDYNKVIDQVACEAVSQTQGSEMKVDLNRYATFEEITKLVFWNYGNDFSTNQMEFPEDISWKRSLVNVLFNTFKAACPDNAVPHGYLNIFRELVMIYLNSVEPRETNNTAMWLQLQMILSVCEKSSEPYELIMKTMKVHGIVGRQDDLLEKVDLYPPEDKVDAMYDRIDWVIDNLWWMFSHAMGKCYPLLPQRAIIAPKFKAMFVREILRPMMNRWADPGPLQDFGPIVGNFNMLRAQRNIRFCVTAAYLTNGIIELQMVRPLRVGYAGDDGVNSVMNRKTGAAIA